MARENVDYSCNIFTVFRSACFSSVFSILSHNTYIGYACPSHKNLTSEYLDFSGMVAQSARGSRVQLAYSSTIDTDPRTGRPAAMAAREFTAGIHRGFGSFEFVMLPVI